MTEQEHETQVDEVATIFNVNDEQLVGILNRAENCSDIGVLFVVGGRQYRTGAQRQFVRLGRHLASFGFPAFRFDVRGMGDSAAEPRFFLDTGPDITAAIAKFRKLAPQVERVLLWGLCDGASAAVVYASQHPAIESVMMVNPWITTRGGAARTNLKHYYLRRLLSTDFLREVFSGNVNFAQSLGSLCSLFKQLFSTFLDSSTVENDLPHIVFAAAEQCNAYVHVVISEKDLTAREFKDEHDKRYLKNTAKSPISRIHNIDADHTFSSASQHCRLEKMTLEWCQQHVAIVKRTKKLKPERKVG